MLIKKSICVLLYPSKAIIELVSLCKTTGTYYLYYYYLELDIVDSLS